MIPVENYENELTTKEGFKKSENKINKWYATLSLFYECEIVGGGGGVLVERKTWHIYLV